MSAKKVHPKNREMRPDPKRARMRVAVSKTRKSCVIFSGGVPEELTKSDWVYRPYDECLDRYSSYEWMTYGGVEWCKRHSPMTPAFCRAMVSGNGSGMANDYLRDKMA